MRAGPGWRCPAGCWLLAALVATGVAVEFCVVYFGAELLVAAGLRCSGLPWPRRRRESATGVVGPG
jgi:hypothetical protein